MERKKLQRKKKAVFASVFVLALLLLLMSILSGCGRKGDGGTVLKDPANTVSPGDLPEAAAETEKKLTDEQALSAVRQYCFSRNPDLEDIVNAGEYPVYWEISSSDEQQITVLFRSYTGAQIRYYTDRLTGETYVTEFVPGITSEEQRTDESFNIRDYR